MMSFAYLRFVSQINADFYFETFDSLYRLYISLYRIISNITLYTYDLYKL